MQEKKNLAKFWFKSLQNSICSKLESIEAAFATKNAIAPPAKFLFKDWKRADESQISGDGGGGTMGMIKGNVFEKGGVNFSTVSGQFSEEFRHKIPGAGQDGKFWASGVSLVIHPKNPLVPAVHMNTRMIVTSEKAWFGGGADLTPSTEFPEDTTYFHHALQACCDRHDDQFYPAFKKWCDEYFYLPHRKEMRGIGGIFYDYQFIDADHSFDQLFAFTQDVGETFNRIYPELVKRHMLESFTKEDKEKQLIKRGRYAEFNLLYDRGTQFGLKTNGNVEAILMSLPPQAHWP